MTRFGVSCKVERSPVPRLRLLVIGRLERGDRREGCSRRSTAANKLSCRPGDRQPQTNLQRELRAVLELEEWVRKERYGVRRGGWRAEATTAIAASAAEETYRLTDQLPDWQNETSAAWRSTLQHVWLFLGGDRSQHYVLSHAVADYLTSPLNHNEGQDGPDDFDRPQTVAAYSAALSAIAWGVDFALMAVAQIFDAIDLKYDGDEDAEGRWNEIQHEIDFVRQIVSTVVAFKRTGELGFTCGLLDSIKPPSP